MLSSSTSTPPDDDTVSDEGLRLSNQRASWHHGMLRIENTQDASTDHLQTGSHLSRHHPTSTSTLGSPMSSNPTSPRNNTSSSDSLDTSHRPQGNIGSESEDRARTAPNTDAVATTTSAPEGVSQRLPTEPDGGANDGETPRANPSAALVSDALAERAADDGISVPPPMKRSRIYGLVFFAALGGFLFGYDTAVINSAQIQMSHVFGFDLDGTDAGLLVSLAVVGAFVGALAAGLGSAVFSRRLTMGVADVFFVAGSAILAGARTMWMAYLGRLIVGFGIGIASVLSPVYLAEVSSPESRGPIVTASCFAITASQFIAGGLGGLFVGLTSDNTGWRCLFAIGVVPALTQLIGVIFMMPESPRWLLSRRRVKEATVVFLELGLPPPKAFFLDSPTAAEQDDNSNDPAKAATIAVTAPAPVTTVGEALEEDEDNTPLLSTTEVLRGIFSSREMLYRLLVGCSLQALQQLVGINAVEYYSSTILKNVGFSGDLISVLLSIPLSFLNSLGSIIGANLIERWGRRSLMLRTLIGCILFLVGMTILGHYIETDGVNKVVSGWIFLVLLGLFMLSYGPGMGTVPWVVMAEVYPNALRGGAAALATMSNWAFDTLVSQCFPIMMGSIGVGPTFGVLTAFNASAFVFVLFFVPETKGVPLELMTRVFATVPLPPSVAPTELVKTLLFNDENDGETLQDEQQPLQSSSPSSNNSNEGEDHSHNATSSNSVTP